MSRERERHIFWRKLFFTDPPSTPRVLSAPLRSTRVSYYVKITPLVHPGYHHVSSALGFTLTISAHPGYWPELACRVLAPVSRHDRSSKA